MTNIFKAGFIFLAVAVLCFSFGTITSAQAVPQIQINSVTNIQDNSATLNANLIYTGDTGANVYFQWGTTTSYNNQTGQQYITAGNSFSQNIIGLTANTIYHFRAVAQNASGTFYSQDMTFNTNGSNNYYYGNGILTATKQVINLSSGNLIWSTSASASPSDIVEFAIALQGSNQDIHNVVVRDTLPAQLISYGNLTVNANSNYGGNIVSGVNIGTIFAGQTVVVKYQAQVEPSANFNYGATTISNSATITSAEAPAQTANAVVVVNRSQVYGVSSISTGETNNPITDSFFLPMLIIVAGSWLYFTGKIYTFADWLKVKIN